MLTSATQNKAQSDDSDEILRLQGVSWMTRKIIRAATLYLTINHRVEDGIELITVDQVLSGGVGGSSDTRILDWEEREVDDNLYGPLVTRTKRSKPADLDNDYLKQDWPSDVQEHGLVHTMGHSDTPKSGNTWSAEMVCFLASHIRQDANIVDRPGVFKKLTESGSIRDMCSSLGLVGR